MATADQIRFSAQTSDPRHRYVWPRGPNGVPLRTLSPEPPLLKPEEVESLEAVEDAHVEILDLSLEDQRDQYQRILDGACKGRCHIIHTDRRWIESRQSWTVLIEYASVYEELPQHAKPQPPGPIIDFQAD